jgi:hypothetical protein
MPTFRADGRLRDLQTFFEYVRREVMVSREVQHVRYAATITPDPTLGEVVIVDVLTGNITVDNPVGAREGMCLHFQFEQDGSGGHTIGFGTDFLTNWTPSTTGGDLNTISFRFDGSAWIQLSAATGL